METTKRKAQSETRARVLVKQNAAVHQVIWKQQKAEVETMAEKTEEELKREIEELRLKEIEISERLRDPRGLRRGPRNFGPAARQRGFTRPADPVDSEDQPAPKRRLSSAVVKVKDVEVIEAAAAADGAQDVKAEGATSTTPVVSDTGDRFSNPHFGNSRPHKRDSAPKTEDHGPKKKPQDTDPTLVSRNRRMLGSLLGTLQKFQKEDRHLSSTEAYMRRSNSLQRAEQKAREESEKLRQQEREKIAENRRRDLTLRARLAAKAEEKRLELLFLRWSEHHKRLGNYLRTKAEPSIYYLPKKPLDEDETVAEQRKEKAYLEWKLARREELSEYQKQIGEQYLANVETELERWQNSRNVRRGNNNLMNLQETMDKELETHQLEHGPKTRKIAGGAENNDDEDDVEDINVGEDDILDDELVVDDRSRSVDVTFKSEESNVILSLDDI